jgi:two-component system, NarL family, nitrate/nitrite response regulator NarL
VIDLTALTSRQHQVAELAATSNLGNKDMATKLGISEGTVKNHLHEIYHRLDLYGRLALIVWWRAAVPILTQPQA